MPAISDEDYKNEKFISKLHKRYRGLANTRLTSNIENIRLKNENKTCEHIERELKELTLNIQVANNVVYRNESKNGLEKVKQSIKCMEECDSKLEAVQLEVDAVQSQLKRLKSERAVLNKKAVSDNTYLDNLKQALKNFDRFSNHLHTLRLKEGTLRRWNNDLHQIAKCVINERMLFNCMYKKLVEHLSWRKKMLIDMANESTLALDDGTDLCKRIMNLKNMSAKDLDIHVNEMAKLMLSTNVTEQKHNFFANKGEPIAIRSLNACERKRRDTVKMAHSANIKYYQQVLTATQNKTGQSDIIGVVDTFKSYESKHFSYYKYLNELNLHIENMIGASASLPNKKNVSHKRNGDQPEVLGLTYWQQYFDETCVKTTGKETELNDAYAKLNSYFNRIKLLFLCLKCDDDSRCSAIKDDDVTPQNYATFLSMIEIKLKEVLSQVYYVERHQMHDVPQSMVTVRDVDVMQPQPFKYDVLETLAHDCAECEVAQHTEDAKVCIPPIKMENLRGLIKAKINSPEMQYRVHNIDKCNIPRSRILYTKYMQNN